MAAVWLDATHRINNGTEKPDRWTDAQERGESWAARYAERRVEARQHVTEARAEVRAVKDEAAAEQGGSWAARYAARRMEAGQHVAEARAELRAVKEAAAAEAPRKRRAMAV